MKKLLFALSVASLALTASAHSDSDVDRQHLGRRENEASASVPDTTPTLALLLVTVASLGVVSAFQPRPKP